MGPRASRPRSEEHTSELQSQSNLVCRLLLEKKTNSPRSIFERGTKNSWPCRRRSLRCADLCTDTRRAAEAVVRLFPGFFFFKDTATTEIYTLSLHDALPI